MKRVGVKDLMVVGRRGKDICPPEKRRSLCVARAPPANCRALSCHSPPLPFCARLFFPSSTSCAQFHIEKGKVIALPPSAVRTGPSIYPFLLPFPNFLMEKVGPSSAFPPLLRPTELTLFCPRRSGRLGWMDRGGYLLGRTPSSFFFFLPPQPLIYLHCRSEA